MAQAVQALEAKSHRDLWVAGDGGLLLELGRARVSPDFGVYVLAAQKTLDGTVVTTRMTGLIAGRKRIVDRAFDAERFPADGVNDRMTVAPEFWIFDLVALNELQGLQRRMVLERFTKETIKAFGAIATVHTGLNLLERR